MKHQCHLGQVKSIIPTCSLMVIHHGTIRKNKSPTNQIQVVYKYIYIYPELPGAIGLSRFFGTYWGNVLQGGVQGMSQAPFDMIKGHLFKKD